MLGHGVPFPDKAGEIAEHAELHDYMYVRRRLIAIYQGNDVWVLKALKNIDLQL